MSGWRHTLEHAGRQRAYLLHVPPENEARPPQPVEPADRGRAQAARRLGGPGVAAPKANKLPLVVMFHGAGGSAEISERATGWARKGASAGFLVAYPEATRPDPSKPPTFLRNPAMWRFGQAGQAGQAGESAAVDDVGFVAAALDEIIAGYPVDPARVYFCGFSNGASFAMVAGAALSTRVAAVAAVAGKWWDGVPDMRRPLPLLYISGDADPWNPLEGGQVESPWGTVEQPPLSHLIVSWSRAIGCPSTPENASERDGVRLERYGPGRDDRSEILVYTIAGAGHVWPGGETVLAERLTGPDTGKLRATDEIWAFFERHGGER